MCDVCKDVSETQEDYLVLSVSIPTVCMPDFFGRECNANLRKPQAENLSQYDTDDIAKKIQSLSIKTHTERLLHSIELPFSSNKGGAIRLESCLAQFMEVEVLDNQRACDNCYKLKYGITRSEAEKKAKEVSVDEDPLQTVPDGDMISDEDIPAVPLPLIRKGYKRYLLKSTPPFLVIHLKRFQQTGLFGRTQKLDAAIEFDEYLDTSPFIMPSQDAEQDEIISTRYKLYGIVVHSGSLFGGHYIAYIRHLQDEKDDEWVYCSDSHTRTVPWDIVKKCQAYMLFYERVEGSEKKPVEVLS